MLRAIKPSCIFKLCSIVCYVSPRVLRPRLQHLISFRVKIRSSLSEEWVSVSWECNLKESLPSDTGHFLSPWNVPTDRCTQQRTVRFQREHLMRQQQNQSHEAVVSLVAKGITGTWEKTLLWSLRWFLELLISLLSARKEKKKKKKGLIAGFTHSKCIYNYRTAKSFKKNSTFSYVVASRKKIAYLYYYFGLGVFYTEAVLLIKNTSMCVCVGESERERQR